MTPDAIDILIHWMQAVSKALLCVAVTNVAVLVAVLLRTRKR